MGNEQKIMLIPQKWRAGLQTYRRLLDVSKRYWAIFLLGVFGTIVLSLVDAAFAWMVKPLINQGFIHRNALFIKLLPVFIILIFIVRGCAGFMSNYFISRVARNVVRDFRRMIFAKLLKLPARFYDKTSSGHILSTIIYNVEQVATASSAALITTLREFSLFVGLVVVMFVVSWELALTFLIVSPFIAWVVKKTSTRMRRLSMNVQESVGDVTHIADESIQGYKAIRLYGGQAYESDKFHLATKRNQQRELKIVVTNSVGTALVQFLVAIPIAITLLVATMPSLGISAGSFASIITAMIMLLRPVRRLTMVNSDIQKGVAGADSIFDILDDDVEEDAGTYPIGEIKGLVEYENVTFTYPSSESAVLRNINFTAQPGQVIAIVGRSGSGKSTLVNLLPRFYEAQQGAIRIDGVNINDYSLHELRQQFSLVSQQPILFNDTIFNNIAYGLGDTTSKEQVIAAAEAAYVMEFVHRLPEGLETCIGEDGTLLSGGQRQRIALARALLKSSPILILDEATSALDTQSERNIQQALDGLMDQCTTVVIAHRLSTIENADWIIVLDDGEIVEQGTHAELLALKNAYANLHQMQFRDTTQLAS